MNKSCIAGLFNRIYWKIPSRYSHKLKSIYLICRIGFYVVCVHILNIPLRLNESTPFIGNYQYHAICLFIWLLILLLFFGLKLLLKCFMCYVLVVPAVNSSTNWSVVKKKLITITTYMCTCFERSSRNRMEFKTFDHEYRIQIPDLLTCKYGM